MDVEYYSYFTLVIILLNPAMNTSTGIVINKCEFSIIFREILTVTIIVTTEDKMENKFKCDSVFKRRAIRQMPQIQ